MVDVGRILDLHLPIAVVGVVDDAGHHLQPLGSLIDDEVDENAGVTEMLFQRRHVGIEAAEQEAAIFGERGDRPETVIFLVERGRIGAGLLGGDRDVAPGAVVGPGMVGADMCAAVAVRSVAHQRAAMAARIDQAVELTLAVTRHDHRLAADEPGEEIVRLGRLAGEADEHPTSLEDMLHFELEDLFRAVGVGMNLKDALVRPVDDQRVDVMRVHGGPSGCKD